MTTAQSSYSKSTIVVIPKATLPHYWKIVCTGAHTAIQNTSSELIWRGPRTENKIGAQVHLMDFYIKKKVDAIVIAPSHKFKINESIDKAVHAGIKVVVIDSQTSTKTIHSFIGTDNFKAGALGAKIIVGKIKKKGPVLLMGHVPGSASIENRVDGFIEEIHKIAPGLSIIRADLIEGAAGEARLVAETIIKNTPSIAGIFAVNETTAEGVLHALDKIDITIPFVGFDYSQKLLKGIKDGRIDALITQTPYAIGYMGVKTALNLIKGKKVPAIMESPVKVLTLENIDSAQSLRCLQKLSEELKDKCPMCFN
nr:substrate-binding domain-containing protein [Maridesulfovibrio hydrothermalis]